MSEYPEHDKLMTINDKSQAIGEFVDWLSDSKRIHLAEYASDSETLWPAIYNITTLLAEFFEIDLDEIEREKRAMLDYLRQQA